MPDQVSPAAYASSSLLLPDSPISPASLPFAGPPRESQIAIATRTRMEGFLARLSGLQLTSSAQQISASSSLPTDQPQAVEALAGQPAGKALEVTPGGNLGGTIGSSAMPGPPRITVLIDTGSFEGTRAFTSSSGPKQTIDLAALAGSINPPKLSIVRRVERNLSSHRFNELPVETVDVTDVRLSPHAADLIADAVPFNRATLRVAIDRFFERLGDLGSTDLLEPGPDRLLPATLALLGAALTFEAWRRWQRSGRGRWQAAPIGYFPGSDELRGFPELPGSWSTRL